MKIDKKMLIDWIGPAIDVNYIINKLTFIGFETYISDDFLNISIPYNRSNYSNLFSLINEISKFLDVPYFKIKQQKISIINDFKNNLTINIYHQNFCPLYFTAIINNINTFKQTPNYIKIILTNNNFKLNNFVIDILNYVTFLTGQPLHAYDADKIHGSLNLIKINHDIIFITINNEKILIKKNSYVICDKNIIISIPGVIGSFFTRITNKTHNIIIESIFLNKELFNTCDNIKTLSSNYFSTGVILNHSNIAITLVLQLLQKYQIIKISNILEIKNIKKLPTKKYIILYKKDFINILGYDLDNTIISNIFNTINFKFKYYNNYWTIEIPYNRYDLLSKENIVAEFLKFYGYNKILLTPIKNNFITKYNDISNYNNISNYLINHGFNEVINYSFVYSKYEFFLFDNTNFIYLKNAISEKMNIMRTSLLQGLLKTTSFNLNRNNHTINIFEIGNVWSNNNTSSILKLACICTKHNLYTNIYNTNDFFFVFKNYLYNIIKYISKKYIISLKNNIKKIFNNNISSNIIINNKIIGIIGLLNDTILKHFSIKTDLFFFEINLTDLIFENNIIFNHISKFPNVKRDISFILNCNITYIDICTAITNLNITNLVKFNFKSIYFFNNKKSLTINFIFKSNTNTLIDSDINNYIEIISKHIIKKFNAKIK